MRLVLLYHGDTAGSGGRCIGRSEVPLSASGRQQMETLASAWTYPAPTLLVASSRQRSYAALAPFARRFGRLPQVDARLDEQDFGDWDGEPWSLLHGRGDHGLQQWLADWSGQAPPGGESFAQMAQRCGGWLDETVASTGDDDLLLVASHAGPLRALACHALSIPLQHALLLRMDHAHVSAMRRRRGRFELCYWNASHFEAGLFGDHP
jgi:broad specificity phosphatase PhoE